MRATEDHDAATAFQFADIGIKKAVGRYQLSCIYETAAIKYQGLIAFATCIAVSIASELRRSVGAVKHLRVAIFKVGLNIGEQFCIFTSAYKYGACKVASLAGIVTL